MSHFSCGCLRQVYKVKHQTAFKISSYLAKRFMGILLIFSNTTFCFFNFKSRENLFTTVNKRDLESGFHIRVCRTVFLLLHQLITTLQKGLWELSTSRQRLFPSILFCILIDLMHWKKECFPEYMEKRKLYIIKNERKGIRVKLVYEPFVHSL